MLVKISESALSNPDKIAAGILRDWWAVDLDTGARLLRSNGRAKHGNAPRWFLILPHDGKLWDSKGDCEQANFRAWNLEEALKIANDALPLLLVKKERKIAKSKQPEVMGYL